MAKEFKIEEAPQPAPGAAVLRLSGRLDAKSAQAMVARCSDLREGGVTRVVLNLADVSFVASSGIGSLLALTEQFQDAGGCLRLVQISAAVRSVVELLNLGEFLRIDDTEQAGLAAAGV
jgi:anti-sigma B factor antagonist